MYAPMRQVTPMHEARVKRVRPITLREREVLLWVSRGKSNYEIGVILGLSMLTIKNHMQAIIRKMNVSNRAHAAAEGLRRGEIA